MTPLQNIWLYLSTSMSSTVVQGITISIWYYILLLSLPTNAFCTFPSSHSSYSDSFQNKRSWYFLAQNSSFTLKAKVITKPTKPYKMFLLLFPLSFILFSLPTLLHSLWPLCYSLDMADIIPLFCTGCSFCLKFSCPRCLHCSLPVQTVRVAKHFLL